jgi:glucan phosphorylase
MKNLQELVVNGCINLGCANGWNHESFETYKELQNLKIPGSGSTRNLGRCYNESSFEIKINDEIVKVISTVDSSD